MGIVNNGILNNYSLKPRNITQYTAFRGVTDFTQIGQFAQFESGYSFLSVLQMPEFMVKLGEQNADIKSLVNSFKHMLEYEFRGLDGLPDITGDTYEITDGINTQRLINKVTFDTAVTVSSSYFEKTGGLITKFTELYLTGIKDKMSQAKSYHGLIKNNILAPGPEHEIFTMLYYVTDNTMLNLERAVLLANCQFTTARLSDILNSTKGDISNKEISLEWNCFPIMGYEVDKAANKLLQDITGVATSTIDGTRTYRVITEENVAALDSADYKYGIMDANSPSKIDSLVSAIAANN
jgi:hypothetical protein